MIELGLQRISKLLANTPLPWRAIHVAGTNGKGSVCAYISEMLNTYNRSAWRQIRNDPLIRHGRYTSPHVVDRWDCITLSEGTSMKDVDSRVFLEIEQHVQERDRSLEIRASEFELLTATAFEVFTRSKLDVAVIETGMGGRLDATNILGQPLIREDGEHKDIEVATARPSPLVTAITNIGIDHQGFLGDTIEAIAREKAGIFKPNVPVTWDTTNVESVQNVLRQTTLEKSSASFFLPAPGVENHVPDHVKSNMGVAYAATRRALADCGRIDETSQVSGQDREALESLFADMATAHHRVIFPGRLEWVDISNLTSQSRPALLDGAHNAQSAEVLGQEVEKLRKTNGISSITWVVAASDTKDVKEILRPLLRAQDILIAVEFGPVDGMPWVQPMKASAITAAAKELVPSLRSTQAYGNNIQAALRAAAEESQGSHLVIAGSLYLVGDIHRLLRTVKT